ncbi:putative chemoreceptor glutamine deamidase CheD [Pseudomonas sp. 8Z]|uniref:chemotaxis protein CheD n=1 Tax=Pseudomonas sp. 8Z TaxID=2653166 RepID=UPI0012F13A9A|nr:chemotaxis protein CheD [Pseudomonas sp. 8Z]VXC96347.1 putative chemoreceptor glutamine deamidase CheD [Pseudomonas sp. 8Z]
MHKPNGVIEVFLQPGDLYFGDRYTRIRTLLGSCVSLVLWHKHELLGGMCHYMLPTRKHCDGKFDGRYADEALHLLIKEIRNSGTQAKDYRISLFGGGNMFGNRAQQHVGQQNVHAGLTLLEAHGLHCHARHAGGDGYRNLIFDVWSGHVSLRCPSQQQIATRRYEAQPS